MTQQPRDVRRVEIGLEEKGVVTFVRMDGDVHRVDVAFGEVLNEFCLFFGIEAEVGVDRENQPFLAGIATTLEEFLG